MATEKDNNKTPQSMAKSKMQNRNGNDKGHTRENIDKMTMTQNKTLTHNIKIDFDNDTQNNNYDNDTQNH